MDYQLIDADNHYYEAEDCFTRYGDEEVKRFVRWVSEGKRRHLLFGDVLPDHGAEPDVQPDHQARVRSTSGSRTSPRAASGHARHERPRRATAS